MEDGDDLPADVSFIVLTVQWNFLWVASDWNI